MSLPSKVNKSVELEEAKNDELVDVEDTELHLPLTAEQNESRRKSKRINKVIKPSNEAKSSAKASPKKIKKEDIIMDSNEKDMVVLDQQSDDYNAQEDMGKGTTGDYFWKRNLHDEFMRHFSVWGKTWKVVSQKMIENGISDKD